MRCAIIGAGAAGLMAAATLQESAPDAEIFLLERNDGLGKKVIISGGGRCNVTTGLRDVREVLAKYPRGNKFLTTAMYAFPPASVYTWFESHGVPLKMEEDLRCFPQSDDGRDVVRVFEKLFEHARVRVMLKTNVVGIDHSANDSFIIHFKDSTDTLAVDRAILTTGGQAYRHTGSTGDGYAFAASLGHTITPLAASLNAFFTREKWPAEISGLSFTQATITAKRGKGISFTGPFLFTHKGVSGPAVFALSSLVAFESYDAKMPLAITLDLFPQRPMDALFTDLEKIIAENPAKSLPNTLAGIVPKSLSHVCVRELSLEEKKHVSEVSKKDLRRCVAWLKAIPLQVIQRGAGDEFVTAGGVPTTEVNPKTMESKICPGLFFAGEILDVDGFTGGFNLQASWATGRLAGSQACLETCPILS